MLAEDRSGILNRAALWWFDDAALRTRSLSSCSPLHDVIDRRDESFRELLGRMARARVLITDQAAAPSEASDAAEIFRAAVIARGLQPFDQKPLAIDGRSLPYAWRSQRVVAVPEAEYDALKAMLEDRSLMVIELPEGRETDPSVLNMIAAALTGTAK
jgi:hypothetical protein